MGVSEPSSGSRGICREKSQRGRRGRGEQLGSQLLPGTPGDRAGTVPAAPLPSQSCFLALHRGLSQALLLFLNLQTFFMRPFLHRFWALHLSCCQSSFKHQHLDERLKNITNYQQKQESQKIFSCFSRTFFQHRVGRAPCSGCCFLQKHQETDDIRIFRYSGIQVFRYSDVHCANGPAGVWG